MDLRAERKSKGLTQAELAELAGVKALTISLIENGKSAPQARTRKKLERALGYRIDWMAGKGQRRFREDRSDFALVEGRLRKVLYDVNFFEPGERRKFLKLAKRYIRQAEEGE